MFEQTRTPLTRTAEARAPLTPHRREEIVRRYWMKGELTPLGVANWLAGQPSARVA